MWLGVYGAAVGDSVFARLLTWYQPGEECPYPTPFRTWVAGFVKAKNRKFIDRIVATIGQLVLDVIV